MEDDTERITWTFTVAPINPMNHVFCCRNNNTISVRFRLDKGFDDTSDELRRDGTCNLLSDSNSNVNSMINTRVSLFYRYLLEASHHIVCPCTLWSACVVCPGTGELVGQQYVAHPPKVLCLHNILLSPELESDAWRTHLTFNICF